MMKRELFWILMLLMGLFATSCASKYQPGSTPQIVDDEKLMLGSSEFADLLHFFPNWAEEAAAVQISEQQVKELQGVNRQIRVDCYFGSWCGDSRRGVPPFYLVWQQAENANIQLNLIGVNRDKVDPEFKALDVGIERVPTFVIFENDQEIGRLIEFPQKDNFVADLMDIL